MSSFSPYSYRISQFSNSSTEDYFNVYTFLTKPTDRNVYKVSLGQMINYLVDFGIGYNSICETTISDEQQFQSAKYVNRHSSKSDKRPATIADLKEFLLSAIRSMINHVVNPTGATSSNYGVRRNNILYPRYFFTLDTNSNLTSKFKTLTGKNYIEVTDFKDFAYSSGGEPYSMLEELKAGYIPSASLMMCPPHTHEVNKNMGKCMKYEYGVSFSSDTGNTMWGDKNGNPGHACDRMLQHYEGRGKRDAAVNPIWNGGNPDIRKIEIHKTYNWQYPTVECLPNEITMPQNNVDGNVTIRYPGRRYRLFKRIEDSGSDTYSGNDSEADVPFIQLESTQETINSDSSTHTLNIRSNISWTAESDSDDWLTVNSSRDENNSISSDEEIHFSVQENNEETSRLGKIIISSEGENNISSTLIVVQLGTEQKNDNGEEEYSYKPDPDSETEITVKLILNSSSRTFASNASTWKELKVKSTHPWTADSSSSWIKLRTLSGTGNIDNGEILSYDITENSGSDRNGTITISNKYLTKTFKIIQNGIGGSSGSSSGTIANRDWSKYIINPYKPFFFKEDQPIVIDNRDPMYGKLDFGLGGDIAAKVDRVWKSDGSTRAIYNKNGYKITIPNERRTLALIVGQNNFNPDPPRGDLTPTSTFENLKYAIPSENNLRTFMNTVLSKHANQDELLGLMVDCEAFMCNYDDPRNYKPWNNLYTVISELENRLGRKLAVVGSFGCGGGWGYTDNPNTIKAADRLFDVAILWNYGASVSDYKNSIDAWRRLGFRGQMGIHQRMYTSENMHRYASQWKDFVNFCKTTKYEFTLRTGRLGSNSTVKRVLPLIFSPIALDGKCMPGDWNPNDPQSNVSLAKALANKYV